MKTLQAAEDLAALKFEQSNLAKEIGKLKKMISTGFEGKLIGADKVAKVYGSNDNDQLTKFYEFLGGCIKTSYMMGNGDKLQSYLKTNHGIDIEANPRPMYETKAKKKQKFDDLYNEYFMEPAPKSATTAMTKILGSMSANYKELIDENVKLKEELEAMIDSISDTPLTLKTLIRMLSKAKSKDMEVADVASEMEAKLSEEQIAVNLVQGADEDE